MKILHLSIENYKSLRSINVALDQLNAVVGANAAGKSNFTDCLDFISEVYRHGLEVAVGRKGGYDNIAFRKIRRSKKPIKISLSVEFVMEELSIFRRRRKNQNIPDIRVDHSFMFVARGYSIKADFEITAETVVIKRRLGSLWEPVARVERTKENLTLQVEDKYKDKKSSVSVEDYFFDFSNLDVFINRSKLSNPTELFVSSFGRIIETISLFTQLMGGIRVFQINPTKTREFGVPTPTPELDRFGANLPAVIDMMQKKHLDNWKSVLQSMRVILPDLQNISIDYTSSKNLGLFFHEKSQGRPWSVEEVSDGTIQTRAILTAIYNPSSTLLVIEEPENSVHPWIIRHIIDACREASKTKQIVITTHSPIVINSVEPKEVWVIWRHNGESSLVRLSELDPEFFPMWQNGDIPTFEYIDSGALLNAIPPQPSLFADMEEE